MQLAVGLIVFLAIMCLSLGIFQALDKRSDIQDRLEMYVNEDKHRTRERQRVTLVGIFKKISSIFAARTFTERIQLELLQAGIPLKGEEFVTVWLLAGLGGPIITWFLSYNAALTVLVILICSAGPRFYVRHKKNDKLKKLNQQLSDALVIMANGMRAGFGFQQAMDTVTKELPPPIANEFAWTLREIQLGSSTEEALQNMSERVKSDDLDMIVTAVLIQRQVGGNLAQILDNISRTIRDRTRIKGEIKTLTAQGRLSGLIIGLLPVALLFILLIINPDYMNSLLQEDYGFILLGAAALSELLGLMIINKIVDIDV
ncbi:MAG: secretion system protein [Syntrophomonadaceae bacterium]|jgi:tight adherence protein B|nr:secretion system protein [Syntrophomonadaceae bacterium]